MFAWEPENIDFFGESNLVSKPNPPVMDPGLLDPSLYMQYTPPTGLPQESKLASFIANRPPPLTHSLSHAMGKLSLDSPPVVNKVMYNEFTPVNYFSPSNLLPESPEHSPPALSLPPPPPQVHQENVGGTTYFYTSNPDMNTAALNAGMMGAMSLAPTTMTPYGSQMYAAPVLGPLGPKSGLGTTYYMPEAITEMSQRSQPYLTTQPEQEYSDLPENVAIYTSLVPLEPPSPHSLTSSFRVIHRESAETFALRRLHGNPGYIAKRLEIWKGIDHPNVVKMVDYFTTKAFGDISLVVIYEHHNGCQTLHEKYFNEEASAAEGGRPYHDPFSSDPNAPRPYTHQKNAMLRAVACGTLLPETLLWSMIIQLTAGLRAIHNVGLACRNLDSTKVIVNGSRFRISWPGSGDLSLCMLSGLELIQAQQEDLRALGRLTLSLACCTPHCDNNLAASIDVVSRSYSDDLKNIIMFLLSSPCGRRTVNDLMPMIGARFYHQVECLEKHADQVEDEYTRETDNGRLLRILIKLGLVNERPELNMDHSWSETGDRYLLKLFRDYLFHAVNADGTPFVDQAHVTHCLNQLDGGSPTKITLISRDEQSMLVVSYSELKHCLEQAISELMYACGHSESPLEETN